MSSVKLKELARYRVEEALSEIWEKPIGIVIAPSGYGKTTAVRAYLQKTKDCRSIWLSLGPEEVDEVWVWKRICEKFKEINEGLYEQITALGLPANVQDSDYFIDIIRKNVLQQFCLVIDDYHECCSTTINRLLVRIAHENIPMFHILLIGRTYPEIPYEELFLKGVCMIADQRTLSLTHQESLEIFSSNGVELSEKEALHMEEYTDGWIAAVYLSLFDYKRTGCFAQFHSVIHLLKTAIFDKFPVMLQELCIKMSLFPSFAPEEAIYVSECNVPAMSLIELSETFGFIQYDYQSKKYEMHSLLRSVASGELEKRSYNRRSIFLRGAFWNEQNGNLIDAIVYYRNAGEMDPIYHILSGDDRSMLIEAAPVIIRDIIENTPLEIKIKYVEMYLAYIYYIAVKENAKKAAYLLNEAKEEYAALYYNKPWYDELCGEILIIESVLQFNNLEQITDSMRKAFRLLQGNPSRILKNSLLTYGAPQMTMLYYNTPGQLKHTVELEKEYTRYYMHVSGGIQGDWDELFNAEYALLTGNIPQAYAISCHVEEKSRFRRQHCIVISTCFLQLRCLIYNGNLTEFTQTLLRLRAYMEGIASPVIITDYELTYSLVYSFIGKTDEMAGWVRNFNLDQCNRIVRSVRSGCIAYGMLLLKTNQWILLDTIADQILVPYETANHIYVEICGYLYKAIAAYHLEDIKKAVFYFLKAVSLAEPDSVVIPFVERCNELSPILSSVLPQTSFCHLLSQHFRQYQHSLKAFQKEEEKIILTKRELELMELVRLGYRNTEIASQMNIALVTVEKNLTSIYRKLHVSNRASAITKLDSLLQNQKNV